MSNRRPKPTETQRPNVESSPMTALDPAQRYEFEASPDRPEEVAHAREIIARDVPASDWRVTFADVNGVRRWTAVYEPGTHLSLDAETGFPEPAAVFAGGAIAGDAVDAARMDARLRTAEARRASRGGPAADVAIARALELSALADAYRVSGDACASPADRARRTRLFEAVMARAEALLG